MCGKTNIELFIWPTHTVQKNTENVLPHQLCETNVSQLFTYHCSQGTLSLNCYTVSCQESELSTAPWLRPPPTHISVNTHTNSQYGIQPVKPATLLQTSCGYRSDLANPQGACSYVNRPGCPPTTARFRGIFRKAVKNCFLLQLARGG